MAVSVGSVIVIVVCVALTFSHVQSQYAPPTAVTVDFATAQTTGPPGGGYGTTAMMGMSTPMPGEPTEPLEMEEVLTTTVAPTPKPKPKHKRKRPKTRRRRPKNLKPKPKPKTPAPTAAPTTQAPTLAPTLAPTTRAPTPAPTPAPTMAPVVKTKPTQGKKANAVYAAAGGGQGAAAPVQQVKVVPQVYHQPVRTTTPVPATKSPRQYLYEPHSCPKMDVATWENEVVIYDNKNCAIIIRMNPRLRRPTVTFQAPYW